MKQYILGVLFAIVSVSVAMAQNNEKHVFILSGQSNMKRFNPDETFIPTLNKEFGAEQVLVIKDAQGGQPIRRWYKEWQPEEGEYTEGTGDLYDQLMQKVKPALEGVTVKSVTFIWMQGERDAKEGHGNVYKESLIGLINQLKEDLGTKQINFIIGRLSDFGVNNTKQPHWDVIREAQMQAVKEIPNAVWVDCDDLNDGEAKGGKVIKNGLHYSLEGYKVLGERYANTAINLIKKNNTN
ncbi:MAG: sialate O-acetylesterase [Urechidicola sp.]|nr:sialate O-acetylesterase [Urechidicola sp.]